MNIDNFKKNHTNETQNLERKINLLRSKPALSSWETASVSDAFFPLGIS